MSGGGNIKVVVRCRPLNSRELARGAKGLVRMEGNNTYLDPPDVNNVTWGRAIEKETKSFAFDRSYWSACGKDEPGYASQQTLYDDLGKDLLDHAFEGFNTCIFAYGQTGSGKSYSMMGYGSDRGIIPLICESLFERIDAKTNAETTFTVEVSYTEIYQEKVRDLLNPANKGNLKVREHPSTGPYVEGLSQLAVEGFPDIEALMDEGTKARTVAATNMNETSSRSHAVFTLILTARTQSGDSPLVGEKVSKISLVDLAGSERANSTGATGQRLKEGALINKSLTTLGRVIAALAVASSSKVKGAAEKVPYRDSVLTWLLKESLGGNSKTAMIAAISPADYEETLSTLRYADQAKKIKNKAVVNEDPNARLIRELKEELAVLRQRMSGAPTVDEAAYDPSVPPEKQMVSYVTKSGEVRTVSKADLQDQLEASEKLMKNVTESWSEKLERTQEIQKEREAALESLGITIEKNYVGVHAPKKMPHLVNLNEDPLYSECLLYQIKPGATRVGNVDTLATPADIRLSGPKILAEHCTFESSAGKVLLTAAPVSGDADEIQGMTMVNGIRLRPGEQKELKSGYRIILGDFHIFRFNNPEEARKLRDAAKDHGAELKSPRISELQEHGGSGAASPATRPESPMSTIENADWSFARREAVVARLNGTQVDLDQLRDDELNKLYDKILKVRHHRTGTQSVVTSDRPESRASFLDSVTEDGEDDDDSASRDSPSRRPFSGSTWTTERTSIADSMLTLSSPPELDDRIQAVKEEYEEKIKALTESVEVAGERQQMQSKVKMLEEEIKFQREKYDLRVKQLSALVSPAPSTDAFSEHAALTERQEQLARWVLRKWRTRTRIQMAEEAMSKAVLLKEANAISLELGKKVLYQFVVAQRDPPSSVPDSAAIGLSDVDEAQDPAMQASAKPCVAVKVLDRRNRQVYLWSLAKLEQRLQQMRNLCKFIDKPEFSRHFSWEDPFYESSSLPSGGSSWIGQATVSLAALSRNLPSVSEVQVYSPWIAEPVASCRVSLRPVGVTAPARTNGAASASTTADAVFVDGAKLTLEVTVDRVSGLSSAEFETLQLQLDLTTLFGPSLLANDIVTSPEVDLTSASCNQLLLERTVTIGLTQEMIDYLAEGYATVDVFGAVTMQHLDRIERWDEARDSVLQARVANGAPLRGDEAATQVARRNETELTVEQRHDVLAHVEVCELSATGGYEPVPVVSVNTLDAGAFFLRQGLQRRLVITLSHNSGRSWPWRRISNVTVGSVRLLDARGRVEASKYAPDVELRPKQEASATFDADGTAHVSFTAPWDSSVHESQFMNRSTPSGCRVLLRLKFDVVVEGGGGEVPFVMDVGATVQGRDARGPNKLMSLLSSSRVLSRITSVFSIVLTPFQTKRVSDIWRLNTADTYVRGEELLGNWKPRGLSLLTDADAVRTGSQKGGDVEAARAVLAAYELTTPAPSDELDREERLSQAIGLWRKGSSPRVEALAGQPKSALLDLGLPEPARARSKSTGRKQNAKVALVARGDAAAKKGYLAILRDPGSEKWRKGWFVLRRPYLYFYESSAETEELAVINVASIKIERNAEIDAMLKRKLAFAIFTAQNSYFFQSASFKDMVAWIKALDPSLALP